MLSSAGMQRILGVNQLFVKRCSKGKIILLVAKLSDDFLVAGMSEDIDEFMIDLQKRFIVGKIVDGPKYAFGRCEIVQMDNGSIRLSMEIYWKRIKKILMTRTRRKSSTARASANEIIQYRSLAGTLL